MWPMSIKHERIKDKNLVYYFIVLRDPGETPLFFLVSSVEISNYVS